MIRADYYFDVKSFNGRMTRLVAESVLCLVHMKR